MSGRGERLLVGDDSPEWLDVYRTLLESIGYQVELVGNGKAAVEAIMRHPQTFDLVILDMIMPVLGGADAATRIREIRPDIPVIFVTDSDMPQDIYSLADFLNAKVFHKPFGSEQISALIRKMLDA